MEQANNFGQMSEEYEAARRGYPHGVYKYLHSLVPEEGPTVLDVGCGTGISTRELIENCFNVTGADKDAHMIRMAQNLSPKIKYIVAPAHKLPFDNSSFDIVAAFTAFHWFNNEESLREVRRVLKPQGVFFAALKGNHDDETSRPFRKGYMEILKKYAGQQFDSTHKHFNTEILKNLFEDVKEKSFLVDERYTVDDALVLLQSLSLWNLVPEEKKKDFIQEMRMFYESNLVDGFVVRGREIFCLSGIKTPDPHT